MKGPRQVPKLPPRPIRDRSECPNPLTCAKTDDGSAADDDDGAFLLPFEDVPEFAAIPTFVGRFPGMAFKTGPRGLGYYRDVRGAPVKLRGDQVL